MRNKQLIAARLTRKSTGKPFGVFAAVKLNGVSTILVDSHLSEGLSLNLGLFQNWESWDSLVRSASISDADFIVGPAITYRWRGNLEVGVVLGGEFPRSDYVPEDEFAVTHLAAQLLREVLNDHQTVETEDWAAVDGVGV